MEIFLFNLTDIITLTSPKNFLFTLFFSPKSKLLIILERKKYLYFFHNLLETVLVRGCYEQKSKSFVSFFFFNLIPFKLLLHIFNDYYCNFICT